MAYSKTFIGLIVTYLVTTGLLNEADALSVVNAVMVLIPVVFAAYGRWKAGGVSWWGKK